MDNFILIFQIVISAILIVLIVLQPKGVGLGRAWGGANEFYKSKRGVEKIIFYLTVAFTLLFLLSSFATLILT